LNELTNLIGQGENISGLTYKIAKRQFRYPASLLLVTALLSMFDAHCSQAAAAPGADERAWTEAAHMLKGGAGGVGAHILQHLSDEAQHFAGTTERRSELYRKIRDEYDRVKNHLNSMKS
jgi:HPt (histidine-containing phosphotransfer) domain-containing protein